MSLKQSIVVVNEYTVKSPSSGKASRGATPGEYVTRYMARDLATETLAPIRRERTDDFIMRYMAREAATEGASSAQLVKAGMREAQGVGGVSFGYGQVSLSHEDLKKASADIQRHFDNGATVMKTVLSFDEEYLRKHNIIEPDFTPENRGDYRGNIDQMKLRMAVMHALNRVGYEYDDLRYVGVIQVDTMHVHCHLAMVDAGKGRLTNDGTQKGKLDARAMSLLRRGIDSWLDENQTIKHLSAAVGYEKRNVTTFVKKWAHDQILRESTPQFLLSCLPEDRKLWRADTNDKRMRKANTIVRELVEEVLERPGSPMGEAMSKVLEYANQRRENEELTKKQWNRLVDNGREEIIRRSVNGVYSMLKAMPQHTLDIRTPMLDAMGMDYEEMALKAHQEDKDPLVDFGFRLRSYSTRLDHHRKQRKNYHDQAKAWEKAEEAGVADPISRVMYDFYKEEEEFHAMCMAKYQHFLPFAQNAGDWYIQWEKVAEYGEKMVSLELMLKDDSIRRMKDEDEAERFGQKVYGQHGGALVAAGAAGRTVVESRLEKMRETYGSMVDDLRVELSAKGLKLVVEDVDVDDEEFDAEPSARVPTASIEEDVEFDFDETRGLDMHHMRYDFGSDVPIGKRTMELFVHRAERRRVALEAAKDYLIKSGQEAAVKSLPEDDVKAMEELISIVDENNPILPSRLAELSQADRARAMRRSATVRLGLDVARFIETTVDTKVRETEPEIENIVFSAKPEATPNRDSGLE